MKKRVSHRNIYIICGNLYPYHVGGAEVFNYYLASKLAVYEDVSVVSFYAYPGNYQSKYVKLPDWKPLGLFSPLFVFLYLLIKGKANDIIFLSYSRSYWVNWWPYPLLRLLKGINYVIIIHGGGLTDWSFKSFYLLFFRTAQKVVGVSARISKEYKLRTGVVVEIIKPLIPFEKSQIEVQVLRSNFKIEDSDKVFLIVGSLKELKNPLVIIEAAIHLKKTNKLSKDIKFLFVGDGPLKSQLLSLIEDNNMIDNFRFVGNIAREKIPDFYAISDYYIIPSKYEGTPISLLEAMYNKLLILGSDSPGINEIIVDEYNGYLFAPQDYKKLSSFIENISLYDKIEIRENAFNLVISDYNYQNLIKKILLLIK